MRALALLCFAALLACALAARGGHKGASVPLPPALAALQQRVEDDVLVIPFGAPATDKMWRVLSDALIDYARDLSAASRGRASFSATQRTAPFEFIPAEVGRLMPGKSLSWSSPCFQSVTWQLSLSSDNSNYTVATHTSGHKGIECADLVLLSDRYHGAFQVNDLGRSHTYTKELADGELNDLNLHGLRVFYWPLGVVGTLESIANTALLFMNPTGKQVADNAQFMSQKMQWSMELRPEQYQNASIGLVDSDIESGDYFGVLRLDGLDPLVAWGTGGHTGHTTMALWFEENGNRELYVVESTDSSGLPSLDYWPPPYGIIRTPFQQWVQQAIAAEYHVDILRLAPEYKSKFNETAAQQWFNEVQGMPYGWHTFIYTFLDTPDQNLPYPVTSDLIEIAFSFLDRLESNQESDKGSVYNLLTQTLNHQFNASCVDFNCILNVLDGKNMSVTEGGSVPISDEWTYGPFAPPYEQCQGVSSSCNYSLVCSSFVFSMYKASGIFGSDTPTLQATEQTPKDVYQMAIFDANWERPAACVSADPALPYCQLLGKYVLTLPGYNTIPVYQYMNEKCSAVPPQYYRGPVGC